MAANRAAVASMYGALILGLTALAACGGTGPHPGAPHALAPAVLVVDNTTADTWFITVGGMARGSVAPGRRLRLDALKPGRVAVLAKNEALRLAQRADLRLTAGDTSRWALQSQLATLHVHNPRATPVEILIDGETVGYASPGTDTTLAGVPAGQRTMVAKATEGPGAVQARRYLAPQGELRWAVPALVAALQPNRPRAPAGKSLIWMKNTSNGAVYVTVDGGSEELVFADALKEIVVAPGVHQLRVRREGTQTTSQHRVTLQRDQVAEWSYPE